MKTLFKAKPVSAAVAILAATSILVACGGGGGGGLLSSSTTTNFTGGIVNSPIDNAAIEVLCKDGSIGGTGTTVKGAYNIAVSCAAVNFPIVIKVVSNGIMAGPDMQFGTNDDENYNITQRAPLKVAIGSIAETASNMNAMTTLAAQNIETKILAKEVLSARDVATAETNVQIAFGFSPNEDIKQINPVTNPQVARVSAQVLEAVAVAKAMSTGNNIEEVLTTFATAFNAAGGIKKELVKSEGGSNSFDIAKVTEVVKEVPNNKNLESLDKLLAPVAPLEAAIKAKGNAQEEVAKVLASTNANATNLNSDSIKAEIQKQFEGSRNATTSSQMAAIASQTLQQAVKQALIIQNDATIAANEKENRKRAVFLAADNVRTYVTNDVLATPNTTTVNIKDKLVRSAVSVAKSAEFIQKANIVDIVKDGNLINKTVVAGVSGQVLNAVKTDSSLVASVASNKPIDVSNLTLSADVISNVTKATQTATIFKNFELPSSAGQNDLAQIAAINALLANVDAATLIAMNDSQKNELKSSIQNLASALHNSNTTQVTIAGSTRALSSLTPEEQARVLTAAASKIVKENQTTGSALVKFEVPPAVGTALINAAEISNSTYTSPKSKPTVNKTTLEQLGNLALNQDMCSNEEAVTNINVAVPIMLTASRNGLSISLMSPSADVLTLPPAVGTGTSLSSSSGLVAFIKVNGKTVIPKDGKLIGSLNLNDKFQLCLKPTESATIYELSAKIGSRYDFGNQRFDNEENTVQVRFNLITPATTTTTTAPPTTTTTAAPVVTTTVAPVVTTTIGSTTTTTLPACGPFDPPPTPGSAATCTSNGGSTTPVTTSMRNTTTTAMPTTTTAAPVVTTTIGSTTTTTLPACGPFDPPPTPGAAATCTPSSATTTTAPVNTTTSTTRASTTTTSVASTTTTTVGATLPKCDPFAPPPAPGSAKTCEP